MAQHCILIGAPVDSGATEDYLAAPAPSSTLVFVAAEVDRGRSRSKTGYPADEDTKLWQYFTGCSSG